MPPFLVCIHDGAPLYTREIAVLIRDLAPLVGRRLSVAVVPDWHREWPLTAHPGFCRLVQENSGELLLHGYSHQRRRGGGPLTFLAEGSDEMNGMDPDETRSSLERGQQILSEVFGKSARGFLAPAWQPGQVGRTGANTLGLDHVLGFFSLVSGTGQRVPLNTWTWDCGRWDWLGHLGHGAGRLLKCLNRGVPALAIHPRDLERGFWPKILRLTRELLDAGYQPMTPTGLLLASDAEAVV